MKKITCTMFGLFFILTGIKSETTPLHFEAGKQRYVVANSGLNMRSEPNSNSLSIRTIPYGDIVNILPQDYECLLPEEINWVKGYWIKVEYKGDQGFVFDGYLSPLVTPESERYSFEEDNSLIISMDEWIFNNLEELSAPDTIATDFSYTIKHHFENGVIYEQQLYNEGYRSRMFFKDVRVMDIYHLLKGFFNKGTSKELIDSKALFIKDKTGHLNTIKIYHETYTEIKRLNNGLIRLTMNEPSSDFGC